MKRLAILLFLSTSCFAVRADVSVPKIFCDHMVLQRGKPIPVWGWASANEKITINFHGKTKSLRADKNGNWKTMLATEAAGGPYTMEVTGKNTVKLNDILIGEVWVCSGQSNMEFMVKQAKNASQEISSANFPGIRQFTVAKSVSLVPEKDVTGGNWQVCSPATVGEFTAVGYFYARELVQKLNVPVGIIYTNWGGTMVETWTGIDAFAKDPAFSTVVKDFPRISIDSLSTVRTKAIKQRLLDLQGGMPSEAEAAKFKEASYPDQSWPKMKLPGYWEQQALGDIDGVVWFRHSFTLEKNEGNTTAVLELGMVDDIDETYVNGVKVGSITGYSAKRVYTFPANLLKEGENTIAVRVEDNGGGGGIYGNPEELKLVVGKKTISVATDWSYKVAKLAGGHSMVGPNTYPALLFNAMIHPIIPYAIQGALWYQGEANVTRAYQYRTSFPMMINNWREHWKQGDFPFYFVQLANFNEANGDSNHGSTWAELREAQTLTLKLPNTGMSITTDIVLANDIHPTNKQDVGKRLAAIALNKTYGLKNVYSGPVYQSIKIEGNKVHIAFSETGSGLMVNDKYGYLKGLEVAGADHKFYYAKAYLINNEVIAYSDEVSTPVAVRYAWSDNPEDANLYNKEGFPAGPFRSDNWKGMTEDVIYSIGK